MQISPVGRSGTPEDIAGLVPYLASKDSRMVTGTFTVFINKISKRYKLTYISIIPINRSNSK